MCTVTFLPAKDGFILTSNRDEWTLRESAVPPQKYIVGKHELFFPKDQKAGGTWIAGGQDHTLCLLNGAFEKHIPKPPYRKSRGLMVLDFFQFHSSEEFIGQYDFNGIENFTLVVVTHSTPDLTELRWDGHQLHVTPKAVNETHIWSSATLYTDEVITERKQWFIDWLESHNEYKQEDIVHFHQFGGKGDIANDILMNREDRIKTVSITSIIRTSGENHISYLDMQTNERFDAPMSANEKVFN